MVQDIKTRHQKRFFWDTLDDSFKVRTKDAPEGILLPANKFIVHKYKARSGHTSRAGILRVVAWMYLFKNYDLKDWASFAEIYGLPLRLGKYAPGASDSDKAALMRALIQIGSDAAGIIPDGTSIDFITTEKTSSSDLYERLARYCDEQISKAILGQTLTSDSGGGSCAEQDAQRRPARSHRRRLQGAGVHPPARPHPPAVHLQLRRGQAHPLHPLRL